MTPAQLTQLKRLLNIVRTNLQEAAQQREAG
jgi:hypothetical protein